MRIRRKIAKSALVVLLVATSLSAARPAASDDSQEARYRAAASVDRIAGTDRFATAAALSQDTFGAGVSSVFIASGRAFPDALGASAAAAHADAPLLLAERDTVPEPTRTELSRLNPARIVVVGGSAAIGNDVVDDLAHIAPTMRIAGATRYETAAALAEEFFPSASQVFVAGGENFPDALVGAAAAGRSDSPVLLVPHDELPEAVTSQLERLQPNSVMLLGGLAAIDSSVEIQLGQYTEEVRRVAGRNRYETAAAIVRVAFPSTAPRGYLATGDAFPDALSAAAVAGMTQSAVLLVRNECMPTAVGAELSRLAPTRVTLVGGPSAVGDDAAAGVVCAGDVLATASQVIDGDVGGTVTIPGHCAISIAPGVLQGEGDVTVRLIAAPPTTAGDFSVQQGCAYDIDAPWDKQLPVRIGTPAPAPVSTESIPPEAAMVMHYHEASHTWRVEPPTYIDFENQWIYADTYEVSLWGSITNFLTHPNTGYIAEALFNCAEGAAATSGLTLAVLATGAGAWVAWGVPLAGCLGSVALNLGLEALAERQSPGTSDDPASQESTPSTPGVVSSEPGGGVTSGTSAGGSSGGAAGVAAPPGASATLGQGPAATFGYRYAVSLTGFPANSHVTVSCHDSVDASGFYWFTLLTDSSGNAFTQSQCYSADGPEHWVIAGGRESNHLEWNQGGDGDGGGDGRGGGTTPPASIELQQGGPGRYGYWYSVQLRNFTPGSTIRVSCHDSVDAAFYEQDFAIDAAGNAADTTLCYSADGPAHWVTGGGVTSNTVTW